MYLQQQQKELLLKQNLAAAEKNAAIESDFLVGSRDQGALIAPSTGPVAGAGAPPSGTVLRKLSSGSGNTVGISGPASRLEKKLELLSQEDARVLLVRLFLLLKMMIDCT